MENNRIDKLYSIRPVPESARTKEHGDWRCRITHWNLDPDRETENNYVLAKGGFLVPKTDVSDKVMLYTSLEAALAGMKTIYEQFMAIHLERTRKMAEGYSLECRKAKKHYSKG